MNAPPAGLSAAPQIDRIADRNHTTFMKELGLKSVASGDMRADNERVNVVSAFVGLHRLQVHHVAHDGIVVADTVGAQDVARHAGTLQRHPYVVTLGHGDMLVPDAALVF